MNRSMFASCSSETALPRDSIARDLLVHDRVLHVGCEDRIT